MQQTAQSTAALDFVGKTVGLDGTTAPPTNGFATWSPSSALPAAASVNITNAAGQTVFSTNMTLKLWRQPGLHLGRKGQRRLAMALTVPTRSPSTPPSMPADSPQRSRPRSPEKVEFRRSHADPAGAVGQRSGYPLTKIKRVVQNRGPLAWRTGHGATIHMPRIGPYLEDCARDLPRNLPPRARAGISYLITSA